MCTGTSIALISAALSAAGTGYGISQQNRAMKSTNNQIAQQNKLLSDQFSAKEAQKDAAQKEQARIFEEQTAAANAEYQKQREMADKKSAQFQETVKSDAAKAPASTPAAEAEARRAQVFQDTAGATPGDFKIKGGGTENRVLRQQGEAATAAEDAKTAKIIGALNSINAQGDARAAQGSAFRQIGLDISDAARKAQASNRIFQFASQPRQFKSQALDRAIGYTAATPYFRGQEPVFQSPDTTGADLAVGAGNLGLQYGVGKMMAPSIFQQRFGDSPPVPVAKPV